MVSMPAKSANTSDKTLERMLIVVINVIILILGLTVMLAAAALAIRTDANGQLLGFTALVGAGFFVVAILAILGARMYDTCMYLYFVITTFIAVITLFIVVYVMVNREELEAQFQSDIQENWSKYWDALGSDIQSEIEKAMEDKGNIMCTDDQDTSCCTDAEVTAGTCAYNWYDTCINVEVLPDECYEEVRENVEENLTIVAGSCVGLVILACIPLFLVFRVMGFKGIVTHTQIIVASCMAVVAFFICIGGGVAAGYSASAGLESTAMLGYIVLVFGVLLLGTSIITIVSNKKDSSTLQMVAAILFGVLALVFLLLFIFCFAGQTRASEYMAKDCNAECETINTDCWKTIDVEASTDDSCVVCDEIKVCTEYIYFQSQIEVLTHLEEDYAECNLKVSEIEDSIEDNQALVDDVNWEVCEAYLNSYNGAVKFYGDDYEAWTANILSYMTQIGYVCAFTFLFCLVQVASSVYASKTKGEFSVEGEQA